MDSRQRSVDAFEVVCQHAGVAGPFLAESDGCGVLHVGAADLDDAVPCLGLHRDRLPKCLHRRNQPLHGVDGSRDVHGRWKRVVRRLRHVDVIVRMYRRLAAECRARELAATVGNDLVHVHVELGAAAGHPDMQREHVVMLTRQDLIADLDDLAVRQGVEPAALVVGVGRGLFEDGIGGDHFAGHQVSADAEMLERALGLRAPELVDRYRYLTQAVGFDAYVVHGSLDTSQFVESNAKRTRRTIWRYFSRFTRYWPVRPSGRSAR